MNASPSSYQGSLKPYIGTRDFYPDEMEFRQWMFGVMEKACCGYGYRPYQPPLLELLELYRAKSSEEIVGEQVYSFRDRGNREVAIRPELTVSLARMFAARVQDFALPARLYNIGNFMRYERPGRGRLREFWQLNVDLLGSTSTSADAEVLMLAIDILRTYGADHRHFRLHLSDRRLMESWLAIEDKEQLRSISRLIDKKAKISNEAFEEELKKASGGDAGLIRRTRELLELRENDLKGAAETGRLDPKIADDINSLTSLLGALGYDKEVVFDPSIARGFDYYTGFVFEINDLHPENNRALFGGGRYDKLIGLFGKQDVPAVGFGMGDVTLENFIKIHNLSARPKKQAEGVFVALMDDSLRMECLELAREFRQAGLLVEAALEPTKKFGKQFQLADRKGRRFVAILGEEELSQDTVKIKDLSTGQQENISRAKAISRLQEILKNT